MVIAEGAEIVGYYAVSLKEPSSEKTNEGADSDLCSL